MADWQGAFRTNYFKVKDESLFKAWANSLLPDGDLGIYFENGQFALAAFCMIPNDRLLSDSEIAALPEEIRNHIEDSIAYLEIYPDSDGIDMMAELATHLQEGEIAVVNEVGYEKLRYLTGYAIAVDHHGNVVAESTIDLSSQLPKTVSLPRY